MIQTVDARAACLVFTAPMHSANHNHHYSARIALGMRLKDWRIKQDRKISQMADLLGVSTATWGHWETGERLPSGDLLLAIEDLTRIPLHVLFCPHLETCPHSIDGQTPTTGAPCCHRTSVPPPPDSQA